MRCLSSTSNLYYIPPVTVIIISIVGVALSIFYSMDFLAAGFAINATFMLCMSNLPGKYQKLKATVNVITDLKDQVSKLEQERKGFLTQLQIFQSQIQVLNKQLADLNILKLQLNDSVSHLKGEVQNLFTENGKLHKTQRELQDQLQHLIRVKDELQKTNEDMQKQLKGFSELHSTLETFHKMCKEDVADAFRKASIWLHAELNAFHSKCNQELGKNVKLMDRLSLMTNSLESTFTTIKEWVDKDMHDRLVETHTRLNKEVSEMSGTRKALDTSINHLRKYHDALISTNTTLEAAVSALQQQLSILTKQNTTYNAENIKLTQQIDRLKAIAMPTEVARASQ